MLQMSENQNVVEVREWRVVRNEVGETVQGRVFKTMFKIYFKCNKTLLESCEQKAG